MQLILGIDLSATPCEVTLSSVDEGRVEVVASTTAEAPILARREALSSTDLSETFNRLTTPSQAAQLNEEGGEADDLAAQGEVPPGAGELFDLIATSVNNLKQAIGSLQGQWTAVSVIIPPHNHLALNLNLPFGDAKNLDRIVDLEVQDVVPFDLEEFLVQYSPLGPVASGNAALDLKEQPEFDVHVGLMPRTFVRNILLLCKACGIEPNIMTVPSSALGSVYHLRKDFFKENSAVMFNRGDEFSMVICVNGEVRVERVLYASKLIPAVAREQGENPLRAVFTALRLMLAATERRYNTRIEDVYLLGRDLKGTNLHQLFGRPIQGIQLKEFISASGGAAGISALSVPFAADDTPISPLSNFRARELSFTPKIGEFIRAIIGTARYLKVAAFAVILCLAGVYGVRAYTITRIHATLNRQIATVIPGFSAPPSEIRSALMQAEGKITEELGVLASPAKVTPVDALLEVLRLLPENTNVSIQSIKVSGTKAQITGIAPELSLTERLEKTFKANGAAFSKVNLTSSSLGPSKFSFTIDLTLTQ